MLRERLEKLAEKRIAVVLVLLLCLGIRLGFIGLVKGPDMETSDLDAKMYTEVANNLLSGNGFALGKSAFGLDHRLTAYGDPVYPAFLAAVFSTVGDRTFDVAIVQSVIDTITCWLVFLLALAATGSALAAVLSGLGYACYPGFWLSTATPMTETLTLFICMGSFCLLFRALKRGIGSFALAGAAMGIAILTRPAMLAFPFAVGFLLLLNRKNTSAWFAKAAVYALVAFAVVSPWTIRNYRVFHAFVPVATHGGQTFWGGTGPADGLTLGSWAYPVDSKELRLYKGYDPRIPVVSHKTYLKIVAFQQKLRGMGEVEQDRALHRAGIQEIKEHPGRYAFLAVKKFFRLWLNLWHDLPPSTQTLCLAALNAIILVLAFVGWRRGRTDVWFGRLAGLMFVYTTLVGVVFYAVVRYSYPAMALVIMMAAAFVAGGKTVAPNKAEEAGAVSKP